MSTTTASMARSGPKALGDVERHGGGDLGLDDDRQEHRQGAQEEGRVAAQDGREGTRGGPRAVPARARVADPAAEEGRRAQGDGEVDGAEDEERCRRQSAPQNLRRKQQAGNDAEVAHPVERVLDRAAVLGRDEAVGQPLQARGHDRAHRAADDQHRGDGDRASEHGDRGDGQRVHDLGADERAEEAEAVGERPTGDAEHDRADERQADEKPRQGQAEVQRLAEVEGEKGHDQIGACLVEEGHGQEEHAGRVQDRAQGRRGFRLGRGGRVAQAHGPFPPRIPGAGRSDEDFASIWEPPAGPPPRFDRPRPPPATRPGRAAGAAGAFRPGPGHSRRAELFGHRRGMGRMDADPTRPAPRPVPGIAAAARRRPPAPSPGRRRSPSGAGHSIEQRGRPVRCGCGTIPAPERRKGWSLSNRAWRPSSPWPAPVA